MEYIGKDSYGRKMFMQVSTRQVTVHHVKDTGYNFYDQSMWKGVTSRTHSITIQECAHYKRGSGAAFLDYINASYNINL